MRRAISLRVTCALLTAVLAAAVASAAEMPAVGRLAELKNACTTFAFDPDRGSLLGLDAGASVASLYPRAYLDGEDAAFVGPVPVGAHPVSAVYKRLGEKACFAIGCQKDRRMHVLAAESLEAIGRIELAGGEARSLATALDPADPFVYYSYGGGHGSTAARVRLDTMADEGRLPLTGPWTQFREVRISADGTLLYGRGPWSPSGFKAFRRTVVGGKEQWHCAFYQHRSAPPHLPGPFGLYSAAGDTLYSAALRHKVGKFAFAPQCFLPHSPVVVGVHGKQLLAASLNTLKTVARLDLPAEVTGSGTHVFADPTRDRLVIARGQSAFLLPLDALALPDEPLLVVDVKPPRTVLAGTKVTIPVRLRDKRVTLEVRDAPEGVTLDAGALTWTPSPAQVGPASISLRLAHGEFERTETFGVRVERPSLRVGFVPEGVSVSPDGGSALAWAKAAGGSHDTPVPQTALALLDLGEREVLAEGRLLYPVAAAAVDGHHVYAAPANADRIDVLSREDFGKVRQAFTDSRVRRLVAIGSSVLVAETDKGVTAYAVPGLKRLDDSALAALNSKADRGRAVPIRCRGGWYAGGVLYGPACKKARMLIDAAALPSLPRPERHQVRPPAAWNRRTEDDGALTSATGLQVGRIETGGKRTHLLDAFPAAAALAVAASKERGLTVRLAIVELLNAKTVETVRLVEQAPAGDIPGHDKTVLLADGKRLSVFVGDRLFGYTAGEVVVEHCGQPLELKLLDSPLVLSPDGPTTARYEVRGGEAPFRFELTTSRQGMTIDARQGTATFDGPALLPDAVALLAKQAAKRLRGSGEDAGVAVQALSGELRERYRQLVGAEVKAMPVLVPVGVAVTDGKHGLAMLRHQAVLAVPETAVAEQLVKRAAELERKRAQTERAEPEPGPTWDDGGRWQNGPRRGPGSLDTSLKVMVVLALLVASFAIALVAVAVVIFLIVRTSRSRPASAAHQGAPQRRAPAASQPVELEPLDEPDAEDSSTGD